MRNLIISLVLFIASLLSLVSCQQSGKNTTKAVIRGNYFPFEEKVFLNEVTSANVETLDSADISNGEEFYFEVEVSEPTVFRLAHKTLYPIMVIAETGDTVSITQADEEAWPYEVKGGPECMLLVNYLERLNRDHHKVDSLSLIFQNSQSHPDFVNIRERLNEAFTEIYEGHKEYARKFVTEHPASIASIIVLNGFFREFALFHQHDDFKFYEIVNDALVKKMPDSKYTKDFTAQVENIRASRDYELEAKMRLSPGRLVPDFSLPTTDGSKIGPKDLEGNNLLIYFWASTDAPSRQANKIVKKAYETFSRYGFQVLAISFDKDPGFWEAAIELDSLPGIHATDLKGAGSPVQKLFNLKMRLPAYFLIDTKGRIFDHDRDFGKLQQKIIELYNQKQDY
ncbi:MAG: TlpA disulfide reductase family protein [Bacteroidales bacterium]|nr:TlpA disulfide reductase family protein [Bacteroidales bacterium]